MVLYKNIFSDSKKIFHIHPSHKDSLQRVIGVVALLFFGLLMLWFLPDFHESHGFKNFLIFHTTLETIAIIVAMQVAGVGWNAFKQESLGNIVFLSVIFLGVGILDFSHLLSYHGMPEFFTPNNADKAIYFWLCARLLSTVGLLIFSIFSLSFITSNKSRYILLASVLALTSILHWPLIFHSEWLTHLFFVPSQGLTNLKIYTEYIIILLNLLTAVFLFKSMKEKQSYQVSALFGAVLMMAMSEYLFTLYTGLTDIYNLFGHIYKVIAYAYIYRAIFVTAVERPYKDLDKSQKQLHEKNLWLDNIIENIPHMIFLKDASSFRYVLFNKAGINLTGLSSDSIVGHSDYDFFPKEQADFFLKKDMEAIEQDMIIDIPEEEIQTPRGTRILHTKKIILKDTKGRPNYLLGISEDITQKKLASRTLLKLSLAVEQSPNSIIITDVDGNIEYVNAKFTQMTGYSFDEVRGVNPKILKSNETSEATYDDMWAYLTRGEIWRGELINSRKDKSTYIELATISPVKQADGTIINYVAIKEDITTKKEDEKRIEYLAHFDQLTGLPNRIVLKDRIKYLLNISQRNNEPLAVMFLDIDHFKNINDTLGHTTGDQILIEVSKRLLDTIRDEDTVSRLGGDEFILLFPSTNSKAAMHIAGKLIEAVSKPSEFDEHELSITSSVGIAMYPDDGEDFETLLKHADTAMYKVKNESRNGFHFFTQEMQLNLARNLQLVNALRYAMERNELQLHYQPQVSIEDGHVIGAEALLRWNHPTMGMISPAEFIPIAEDSGQIIEIGEWVLRTAVYQMRDLIDLGYQPIIMAVNLSAIQFRQPGLSKLVTDILSEARLPHQYLELELTEAVTMHNPKAAIEIMNELHNQGIRMSIDDFGTGYSSLSYLKQFKVYKLKIDQSFVSDISADEDNRSIISAIIDMANNLGLRTIAEGVETSAQLAFLRLHGCNEVQGYYFSKPIPSEEFLEFLKNN